MNVYQEGDASLLNRIERVMNEKVRTGRANEGRHGLVAQVANAMPPVNETFRRTLRAGILSVETKKGRPSKVVSTGSHT